MLGHTHIALPQYPADTDESLSIFDSTLELLEYAPANDLTSENSELLLGTLPGALSIRERAATRTRSTRMKGENGLFRKMYILLLMAISTFALTLASVL